MMTVKMEREGKFADVHPAEVANMQEYGWQIVNIPAPGLSFVGRIFKALGISKGVSDGGNS